MRLGVGEFKARCLALIEDLHLNGGQIVLTKRGRPMVVVQPWEDREVSAPTRLGIDLKQDWR